MEYNDNEGNIFAILSRICKKYKKKFYTTETYVYEMPILVNIFSIKTSKNLLKYRFHQ